MHPSGIPIVAKGRATRNQPTRASGAMASARGMNPALTAEREACKVGGASLGEGIETKLDLVLMRSSRAAVLCGRAAVRSGGQACAKYAGETCGSAAQAGRLARSEGASRVGRVQEKGQRRLCRVPHRRFPGRGIRRGRRTQQGENSARSGTQHVHRLSAANVSGAAARNALRLRYV